MLERKDVLQSLVVAIVRVCTRFASLVVVLGLLLSVAAGYYAAHHFAINTDINSLISQNLDWRKRDQQFDKAFDQNELILAVVEARTPEMASAAADALYAKLKGDKTNFQSMQQLGSGEFFEKNGLLFLPTEEVGKITGQFESAAPLIEIMVLLSKSLSGGHVPVGAVLTRKAIFDKIFNQMDRAVVHAEHHHHEASRHHAEHHGKH